MGSRPRVAGRLVDMGESKRWPVPCGTQRKPTDPTEAIDANTRAHVRGRAHYVAEGNALSVVAPQILLH